MKKLLISTLLALMLLVAGCQIDHIQGSKTSVRILRKNESAASRMVSPFGDYNLPMVGQHQPIN
jgi:hypothetical protein